MSRWLFVLTIVLTTLLLQATPARPPVAEEIAKLREQWAQQLHNKQLDPILTLYAPDAVFLSPGSSRVTGQTEIRALFKNVMATFTSNITLHSIHTESSGDLAYDSGEFRETLVPTSGGPSQESQGNYVMILKRQPDGKWRIVQHIWTMVGGEAHPTAK
jgi:uncharacterized protein (TIGR02246 family)